MAARRAAGCGVGGERVLRLGDADRVVAVAIRLQLVELAFDFRIGRNIGGTVNFRRDGFDFLPQGLFLVVDETEIAFPLRDEFDHLAGDIGGARATLGPMARKHQRYVQRLHFLGEQLVLGIRVGSEMVHRYHNGQAELVLDIAHMPFKVRDALLERREILLGDVLQIAVAVILEGPDGRDDHHGRGPQTRLPALDVNEFLRPEVRAETRLRYDVIGELERRPRGKHRVATMRDVGERATVNEGRIVLKRLHQIRLQSLLEQYRHRALCIEVTGTDRSQIALVTHDDVTEPGLQIVKAGSQAEDRHDLRGHHNVEAILARKAVRRAT